MDRKLEHLVKVFKDNDYNENPIRKTMKRSHVVRKERSQNEVIKSIKFPYIQGTTDKIANILRKKRIRVAFSAFNTLRGILDHAKDQVEPKKNKGVYSIPCGCGKVYIGETGCFVLTRLKEHNTDFTHGWIKRSALAEHSTTSKHHILLEYAKVITSIDHYTRRRVREAIEIEKHPFGINPDDRWKLSMVCAPTINKIKNTMTS